MQSNQSINSENIDFNKISKEQLIDLITRPDFLTLSPDTQQKCVFAMIIFGYSNVYSIEKRKQYEKQFNDVTQQYIEKYVKKYTGKDTDMEKDIEKYKDGDDMAKDITEALGKDWVDKIYYINPYTQFLQNLMNKLSLQEVTLQEQDQQTFCYFSKIAGRNYTQISNNTRRSYTKLGEHYDIDIDSFFTVPIEELDLVGHAACLKKYIIIRNLLKENIDKITNIIVEQLREKQQQIQPSNGFGSFVKQKKQEEAKSQQKF